MKLHIAEPSPFVRKVRVLAHEVGLDGRITFHAMAISPVAPDDGLNRDNPIGKVPALVRDDGTALYDSRVICEYLDGLHDGRKMFPASGEARWTALRRQALGDGMLDAGVATRYEVVLRPEAYRWQRWVDGQWSKILRALDALDGEANTLGREPDIGTIAVGCALGYLDFRFADCGWRDRRPALAKWFEAFDGRPSMRATDPRQHA